MKRGTHWTEWEDREIVVVLESETDEESAGLSNVLSEQVEDEFLDVVEYATTLFYGVEDGSEVVLDMISNRITQVLFDCSHLSK